MFSRAEKTEDQKCEIFRFEEITKTCYLGQLKEIDVSYYVIEYLIVFFILMLPILTKILFCILLLDPKIYKYFSFIEKKNIKGGEMFSHH